MINIEFFTDANKGATLQEGVYTIEHKFEPMYALPGYRCSTKQISCIPGMEISAVMMRQGLQIYWLLSRVVPDCK